MKKAIALLTIVLLSASLVYLVNTAYKKDRLTLPDIKEKIEEKVAAARTILTEKLSGKQTEETLVPVPEQEVEKPVRKAKPLLTRRYRRVRPSVKSDIIMDQKEIEGLTGIPAKPPTLKPFIEKGKEAENIQAAKGTEKAAEEVRSLFSEGIYKGVEGIEENIAKAEKHLQAGSLIEIPGIKDVALQPAEGIEENIEKAERYLQSAPSIEIPEMPRLKPMPLLPLVPPLTVIPLEVAKGGEAETLSAPAVKETEKPVPKPQAVLPDLSEEGREKRVAILPFENFSNDRDAVKHVMPVLIGILEKYGLEVVDEESMSEYLCEKRVRANGYVSSKLAIGIKKQFKAKTILTGSVISFSTGENPEFGILARLIDTSDGRILWADYASATGEDFTTILGLGKLETVFSLAPKVMDTLFASFSNKTLNKRPESSPYRIAVLPFQNNTDSRQAGMITMYMFLVELLKNHGFEPIEYGNTRNEIVSLRIRNKGELDYNNLKALSEKLGADGILLGRVDDFTSGTSESSPPQAAIAARLLDSRSNKILWYNTSRLNGEQDIIAFDWGRIRSLHNVAYKAVTGLVKKMEPAKWQDNTQSQLLTARGAGNR